MQKQKVTGVVLAGGRGSRVGQRDKGMIAWRGHPLVSYACSTLRPHVHTLLISCNRNADRYRSYADHVVQDKRRGFIGPLGGLESVQDWIKTEFLVLAPCDSPALPANYVERMLAPLLERSGQDYQLSFAHDGHNAHYLCAALRTQALASVSEFLETGQRRVQDWIELHSHVTVDVSDSPDAFANFNRPTDFTR